MTLLFKPIQNSIASQDGKKKWRPCLVKFNRKVGTMAVSKRLAAKSSQTPGDVYNLLCNLGEVLSEFLLHSQTVYLENLGSFTIIAKTNGNGVDTPEEVSPHQINSLRIQFTPASTRNPGEGVTRAMLSGVTYERYGSQAELVSGDYTPGNDGGDGDDSGYVDPTG